MLRGCTPSPALKIILETTILSISRGLPRLREIKKEKDDIAAKDGGNPYRAESAPLNKKKKMPQATPLLTPYGTLDISISKRINKTQTI